MGGCLWARFKIKIQIILKILIESPSAKKRSIPCPLPEDILLDEIVPRLPAKCVIRFKSVSKTWLSRISQYSSLLAGRHPEPDSVLDKSLRVLRRSGLPSALLLTRSRDRDVVLWNPATSEVNYLPAATLSPFRRELHADYFLGFDAQTGDHKVVRLEDVYTDDDDNEDDLDYDLTKEARIFSRKSGNWRELKSFTLARNTFNNEQSGVTIDGVVYWSITKSDVKFDTYTVLSLDLSTEELREFEGPPVEAGMKFDYLDLLNWKGSLCALWEDGTPAQLWLKNDCNSGWTNISTMHHSWRHLGTTKDEILYNLPDNFTLEWRAAFGPLKRLYCKGICHHFHTLVSPN